MRGWLAGRLGAKRPVPVTVVLVATLMVMGGGLGTILSPITPVSLAPGASLSASFEFAVDEGGSFTFGYDVDAS